MNYPRCFVVALPWIAACTAPGAPAASARVRPPSTAPSPLALSCLGCHQPQVDSPLMPALSDWPAQRIVDSLRSSRDSQAPGSVMARFTVRLTDAQIDDLASQLGRRQSP